MKKVNFALLILFASPIALGYEGPSPLKDIKLSVNVTFDTSKALYTYSYTLTNPSVNNGEIRSIRILMGRDSQKDTDLSSVGLKQCVHYSKHSSEAIFSNTPMVPVGSAAPNGWSCGYGKPSDQQTGTFGWGSIDEPYRIKPGSSLGGFILNSYGLPGIRNVVVQPGINLDSLPSDYQENVEKTVALENSVKWTGQTIGPVAPAKTFVAVDFIQTLISLEEQAVALGWITNQGFSKSLVTKLDHAKTEIAACKIKRATNVVNAFVNEVREARKNEAREEHKKIGSKEERQDEKITSDGYALMYFNGKYLLTQLQNKTNLNCPAGRDDDDRDNDTIGKKKTR